MIVGIVKTYLYFYSWLLVGKLLVGNLEYSKYGLATKQLDGQLVMEYQWNNNEYIDSNSWYDIPANSGILVEQ